MEGRVSNQITFFEHVKELRKRLAWSAIVFIAGGAFGYAFHGPIIGFLKRPLHGPLYYDSPAGNFNLIMEACFMLGLFVALPVLVYNLVRFVEPAVTKRIRGHHIFTVTLLSIILALTGAAFAYMVVLPMSLHFFMGFKVDGVNPLISANSYLDFVIKCILTFIFIFQIPLLILFINHIKPLKPRTLLKYEKYVIVGSFTLALVLPFTYDWLTQFIIAVPIIFLYNLSLLLVWFVNRKIPKEFPKMATSRPVTPRTAPTPKVTHRPQAPRPRFAGGDMLLGPRLAVRATPVHARTVSSGRIVTRRLPVDGLTMRQQPRANHLVLKAPKPQNFLDLTVPRQHTA